MFSEQLREPLPDRDERLRIVAHARSVLYHAEKVIAKCDAAEHDLDNKSAGYWSGSEVAEISGRSQLVFS